jgi:hypothetical protein
MASDFCKALVWMHYGSKLKVSCKIDTCLLNCHALEGSVGNVGVMALTGMA